MSTLKSIAKRDIRKSQIVYHLDTDDATTEDIINLLMDADKKAHLDVKKFAKRFTVDEDGLYRLFDFVKSNIKYLEDASLGDHQKIKSPGALIKLGFGDCKSFSLFIGAVLRNLGIKYKYKFVAYEAGKDVVHVYPVAYLNGNKYVLDAVYTSFNKEVDYAYHIIKTPKGQKIKSSIGSISNSLVSDLLGILPTAFITYHLIANND